MPMGSAVTMSKIYEDAVKIIQEFYLKLRSQYSTEGDEVKPIPISARQHKISVIHIKVVL